MNTARTLLIAGLAAAAATPGPARARETPLEFTLSVTRQDLGFDYPGDVETRYTQAVVTLLERSYPYLHGGFRLGLSDLSQSGNPPTAGQDLTGGSVGFVLRSEVPLGGGFGTYLQGAYDYHTVDASTDSDPNVSRVQLDWFDFTGRAGLSGRRGPLQLRAGPFVRFVDGDERDRGDVDRTLHLRAADKGGGFLDVVYHVDRTGWVGLRLERGSRDAAWLRFTRLFDYD